MEKKEKQGDPRSQRVGLTNSPIRRRAARNAELRQKEAAKRAGFKAVTPTSFKAVTEYFDYVQHSDPEVIDQLQQEVRVTGDCQWCDELKEAGLTHCLHCGTIFVKVPPSPSP